MKPKLEADKQNRPTGVAVQRRVRLRRGKWRVQWYSPHNGCIRQEWYRTKALAYDRQDELERGQITSSLFSEQAAER